MMKAYDFSLPDQAGTTHSLQDYAGKWLVLYFYPKDETSGCIKEACNFRDGREMIRGLGEVEVVGVSKDSVESHQQFSAHYELNFPILSDPDHKVIEAYGAWGALGTKRNTFLINPNGDIVKEYKGVDPATHVGEIMTDLKALIAAA